MMNSISAIATTLTSTITTNLRRNKNRTMLGAAACAALVLLSPLSHAADKADAKAMDAKMSDTKMADTKSTVSAADKKFLIAAAQAGTTEIMASKAASTKAQSDTVKTFATQMVADHTKVAEQVKKLAADKAVELPSDPDKKQAAEIEKLNGLSGAKYDKEYAKVIGVAAHKDAVNLFKKASKETGGDADVKAFAMQTLPALEHHLKMAEELKTTVDKQ